MRLPGLSRIVKVLREECAALHDILRSFWWRLEAGTVQPVGAQQVVAARRAAGLVKPAGDGKKVIWLCSYAQPGGAKFARRLPMTKISSD